MRKGTNTMASWVSSVGTVTPCQIHQEHSSFGGKTLVSTRCKRSDLEMTDIWLPANRSWLLGSMGRMIGAAALCLFLLGAITISWAKWAGSRTQKIEKRRRRKARIRVRNLGRHVSTSISWINRSGAKKCQIITRKSKDHNHHSGITSKIPASLQMHKQESMQQRISKRTAFFIHKGEFITNVKSNHYITLLYYLHYAILILL
jgi:hypothetical protein